MKASLKKPFNHLLIFVFLIAAPVAMANDAQSDKPKDTVKEQNATPRLPAFVYRPPNRGAPKGRVGGGTRSINQLLALAPKHIGLTSSAQPRLYWYIASGFRNPLRFRLNAIGESAPLLEIALAAEPTAGIYGLDLSKHGVSLQPGEIYQWVVMLDPLPHQRWKKIVSAGQIERINGTIDLTALNPEQRPFVAAQNGLWYDALDGISRQVEQDPLNPTPHQQRAELLAQGGLMEASLLDSDRAAALEKQ
jgi:hypothetical protein